MLQLTDSHKLKSEFPEYFFFSYGSTHDLAFMILKVGVKTIKAYLIVFFFFRDFTINSVWILLGTKTQQ